MDIGDFISSQDHMIEYNKFHHVSNNSAHDRLVERGCLLGQLLTSQASLEVPTSFKTMGAYSLLSAVCGAHSSVYAGGEFSLNLWILLVGPSGGRKSSAMNPYQNVMQSSEYLNTFILSENTTTAALRGPLEESHEEALQIFGEDAKSQGMIFAQEFHDFFDITKEASLSSHLVKLWGDQINVKIGRLDNHIELKSPTLSILGSIQTLRVMDVLPVQIWQQGFCARLISVYSDQSWPESPVGAVDWQEGSVVGENERSAFSHKSFLLDYKDELTKLSRSSYRCGLSRESAEIFNSIELPRLPIQMQEYGNRRNEHLRKFAALTAISRYWSENPIETRNCGIVITPEDLEIARLLQCWNDCKIPQFVKDSIRGPDTDMYDRLDEWIVDCGGALSDVQLERFVRNQTDASRLKNVLTAVKSYYLCKDRDSGKWSKRDES